MWHFIILGRLVEDHASATHEWFRWALTLVRSDQRRQGRRMGGRLGDWFDFR
jgi:hypothetical protein